MMDLLISCCGTTKSIDMFQQARIACTTANWEAPPPQPLWRMLEILAGGNLDYDNEVAFNNLLAHLQQDELRKNVTYVLKNLIILDITVEQRLFLNRMSRYYNSQLIYMQGETQANKTITTIKDLIASYYVYIKQKAKYYELQSRQLLQQNERQKFMNKSNSIAILNEVNVCFKIQNLILDVNSKFKNGDKSAELIQFIFSLMLKTYLFCHSIVSIALKTFVRRIPELNQYDLQYIKKFANYFSKDYSKNFGSFITSNQTISSYQQIQYKEMIFTDQKMLQLIETQLKLIYEYPGICPEPIELSPEQLQAMSLKKQDQINRLDSLKLPKEQQKRKQFSVPQDQESEQSAQVFKNYVNGYSDTYEEQRNQQSQNIPQFMDPYQIFSYYGVFKQQYEISQQSEDISQQQQEQQSKENKQQQQPQTTYNQAVDQ